MPLFIIFTSKYFMRILTGVVFIVLYLAWQFYRVMIKDDLREHKSDFYGLTFFISIWLAIYYWIFF